METALTHSNKKMNEKIKHFIPGSHDGTILLLSQCRAEKLYIRWRRADNAMAVGAWPVVVSWFSNKRLNR